MFRNSHRDKTVCWTELLDISFKFMQINARVDICIKVSISLIFDMSILCIFVISLYLIMG